jgi:hypothetical protein
LLCARARRYEPLEWVSDKPATTRWREFKKTEICEHILKEEREEHNFLQYIYQQTFLFTANRMGAYIFEAGAKGGDMRTPREGVGGGETGAAATATTTTTTTASTTTTTAAATTTTTTTS